MNAPEFTTADELKFLAAQCSAQASGSHRDDDRTFLARLAAQLAIVNDAPALRTVRVALDDAARGEDARELVRLAGTILHDRAARIERAHALGMGDAA